MDYHTQTWLAKLVDGFHGDLTFTVYYRNSRVSAHVWPNGTLGMSRIDFKTCLNDDVKDTDKIHFTVDSVGPINIQCMYAQLVDVLEAGPEEMRAVNQCARAKIFWADFSNVLKHALWDYLEGEFKEKLKKRACTLVHKKRKLKETLASDANPLKCDLYPDAKRFRGE